MKRLTLSLLITAAILIVGAVSIWFIIVAPRLIAPRPTPTPTPTVTPTAEERRGALNLYLTAPEKLPPGALRAELTLVKATLVDDRGAASPVFEGVQRVMLQEGVIQKVLSELIPNHAFRSLRLEFSPAAEISMADGSVVPALVGQRQVVLTFEADVPISRSLALFARVPLEAQLRGTPEAQIADLLTAPQTAESYVFGSFQLDARGRGDLWTVPQPGLASAINADLGLDISTVLQGSQGFSPADQGPVTKPSP